MHAGFVKRCARDPDPTCVDWFSWTLLCAVPVLYGLFWWLDYRWLSQDHEPSRVPQGDED
jgi:hypothetical protein